MEPTARPLDLHVVPLGSPRVNPGVPWGINNVNTKLPPERESKIQKSIIVRLDRLGIKLWRRNVGAMKRKNKDGSTRYIRFNKTGQSDLWGTDKHQPWARHWEIETKRLDEKPTPKQLAWLKMISGRGCVAFWSDNANVAERVAESILEGGRIIWHDDENFDVEV